MMRTKTLAWVLLWVGVAVLAVAMLLGRGARAELGDRLIEPSASPALAYAAKPQRRTYRGRRRRAAKVAPIQNNAPAATPRPMRHVTIIGKPGMRPDTFDERYFAVYFIPRRVLTERVQGPAPGYQKP